MSQSDFGTINPSTKSGTQLANDLNAFRTALHTSHSGSSAPSYVTAGMHWYDSTNDLMKFYDGTDNITTWVMDETNNLAFPLTQNPRYNYPTTGGSANAQTLTLVPALTAYVDGGVFTFTAGFTNTGAATLNVNGVGAKNLRRVIGGSDAALTYGTIVAGVRYRVQYVQATDAFVVLDAVGGSDVVEGIRRRIQGGNLTISAGGAISITHSWHLVDTNGGAASDNLDEINVSGFSPEDGMELTIAPLSGSRNIVIRHNQGASAAVTIYNTPAASVTLDSTARTASYIFRSGLGWIQTGGKIT
jgi:hypothetical protein